MSNRLHPPDLLNDLLHLGSGVAALRADWLATPLGPMVAVADAGALHLLDFGDRVALPAELRKLAIFGGGIGIGRTPVVEVLEAELAAFFAGRSARFTVPLAVEGSPFARGVWDALREIPAGQTRSYGQIAARIGRPTASRAVARANGSNRLALLIPCHRVIGADGSLTGYAGGLWRKRRLIEIERGFAA